MKAGDLVKPKIKYSKDRTGVGIVVDVKENAYRDHMIVYWPCGKTTLEPVGYVGKLEEDKE